MTDYVEFDIDPDQWIARLVRDVNSGRYEPLSPYRFRIAKKRGFSRVITFPQIPDLVLYRALTNLIYARAKPFEKGNVFFARNTLAKRVRVKNQEDEDVSHYEFLSGSAFEKWKEFDQHRKRLTLEKEYPYVVLTDVSNYFDSILYARTVDAIQGTDLGRNLVGLLFFLLERLSPRDPYNESPRIGLPVDEFDCSRTLAHIVLYPHDRRMIAEAGEQAYGRWMDDQTIGVDSYADGLRALGECAHSLSRLHLTPNASKSRVLSREEVVEHFHFEVNWELDKIEEQIASQATDLVAVGSALEDVWSRYRERERLGGEWSKILKRLYRLAGICRRDFLLCRALDDILREPTLTLRVADYVRVLGTPGDYLDFTLSVWSEDLQVYSDVNRWLAEGLLRTEAAGPVATRVRELASDLLEGEYEFPGSRACGAVAPLLILRFGDRRALPRLRSQLDALEDLPDPAIGKAVAVVYASYGRCELAEVRKRASTLRSNYLADFLRMLGYLREYRQVPDRFKIRREPVWDSVAARRRVDIRKLLVLKLLRLNERAAICTWVEQARQRIVSLDISTFDKNLVNRLLG